MSSRITVRLDLPVIVPSLSVTTRLPLFIDIEDEWFFEWVEAREEYSPRVTALSILADIMIDFSKDNAQIVFSGAFCSIDDPSDVLDDISQGGHHVSELDSSCVEIEY